MPHFTALPDKPELANNVNKVRNKLDRNFCFIVLPFPPGTQKFFEFAQLDYSKTFNNYDYQATYSQVKLHMIRFELKRGVSRTRRSILCIQ